MSKSCGCKSTHSTHGAKYTPDNCLTVARLLQGVVLKSQGSHWAVIRQSVKLTLLYRGKSITLFLHCASLENESIFILVCFAKYNDLLIIGCVYNRDKFTQCSDLNIINAQNVCKVGMLILNLL